MSQNSVDPDELSKLLAESIGGDAEEIERRAADFEIGDLEEADWEYVEE